MMENQKEKKPQKRCSQCDSAFTYVRIKDGSLVCRNCGNIDQIEE